MHDQNFVIEEDEMSRKFLWMEAVAALVLTAGAMGQSLRADQTARIPFPFVLANQSLPAGTYTLTKVGNNNLRISNAAGQGVLVQTHKVEGSAPEASGKLIFHRYGDRYFLSEVWSPANDIGLELFRCRDELKLQNKEGEMRIAELRLRP